MARTVCPHCGFDRSSSVIAKGATVGAAIGTATVINPLLGAVAALAVGGWKLVNADAKEVVCPHCKLTYEI